MLSAKQERQVLAAALLLAHSHGREGDINREVPAMHNDMRTHKG
jgi:hypothetical protein